MQPEKIHEKVLAGLVAEAARVLDLIDGRDPQHDGEALQQARALLRQITDGVQLMPRALKRLGWDGVQDPEQFAQAVVDNPALLYAGAVVRG